MSHEEVAYRRLDVAQANRALEINLFWQRALFFWGFVAAAFVGVAQLYATHPRLSIAVSCFGFTCSVCASLANRGSRRWHEHWERAVQREELAIRGHLFDVTDEDFEKLGLYKGWLAAKPYSVGKLAIALSDYVAALWLAILAYQLVAVVSWIVITANVRANLRDWAVVLWVAFTLIYVCLLLVKTKSSKGTPKS